MRESELVAAHLAEVEELRERAMKRAGLAALGDGGKHAPFALDPGWLSAISNRIEFQRGRLRGLKEAGK